MQQWVFCRKIRSNVFRLTSNGLLHPGSGLISVAKCFEKSNDVLDLAGG